MCCLSNHILGGSNAQKWFFIENSLTQHFQFIRKWNFKTDFSPTSYEEVSLSLLPPHCPHNPSWCSDSHCTSCFMHSKFVTVVSSLGTTRVNRMLYAGMEVKCKYLVVWIFSESSGRLWDTEGSNEWGLGLIQQSYSYGCMVLLVFVFPTARDQCLTYMMDLLPCSGSGNVPCTGNTNFLSSAVFPPMTFVD